MIVINYEVRSSTINSAGMGIFAADDIPPGKVVSIPDGINRIYTAAEIDAMPQGAVEYQSSVRWFEDRYSAVSGWSDECYYNHSFQPNCVWHLGFVFAAREISAGEEITIDYSHLLEEGTRSMFEDSGTGKCVTGMSFRESMASSCVALAEIFSRPPEQTTRATQKK